MVFTHLPSNVLLILVPLMPTLPLAVAVLLLRFTPQPDGRPDPPVVRDGGRRPRRALGRGRRDRHRPDDRRGDLAVASRRVLVASAGYAALPFYLAGGLKIVYDLLLYRDVPSTCRPPEERGQTRARSRRAGAA